MKSKIIFIVLLGWFFHASSFSQASDSLAGIKQPLHWNVIKFNPTPMILWSWKNITFSYERILNPRQSISVELGYLEFPKLVSDSLINLVNITTHSKWGLNATIEYRFYLTRLSTRPVPAGLYLGPYFTFYTYHFNNGFDILHTSRDSTGMIKGDYWSFNLGAEIGYQFVFWKRMTVDLVMMGPSLSYYGGKTAITGNLTPQEIQEINEDLYNKLAEKYPFIGKMSLDKTYQQTGKLDALRMGFRYLVQVGYHF